MLRIRTLSKKSKYAKAIPGDILCSDLSIVMPEKYVGSGKEGIGVVYYNNGKILFVTSGYVYSGVRFSMSDALINELPPGVYHGLNSKQATDIIYGQLGASNFHGAGMCRSFYTNGTQAGDWNFIVPEELDIIYNNLKTINKSLVIMGKSEITFDYSINYWRVAAQKNDTLSYVAATGLWGNPDFYHDMRKSVYHVSHKISPVLLLNY